MLRRILAAARRNGPNGGDARPIWQKGPLGMLLGYPAYLRSGQTPRYAALGLRETYLLTNGWANDALAAVSSLLHPPQDIDPAGGILGLSTVADVQRVCADLDVQGYHCFAKVLPDEACAALQEFAERAECDVVPAIGEGRLRYDRRAPVAPRYELAEQHVLEHPYVQGLAMDPSLLAVAQAYLRAQPVLDLVAMWWSAPFRGPACSEAAQLFHFDMDRLKFLKFFFYLTDVDAASGPHCYVAGSHRRKPVALLRDRRLSDAEVEAHYARSRLVTMTGPRGTAFVADTRGLHKGTPVLRGERLIVQIEFANSLFGQSYNRIDVNDRFGAGLRAAIGRHPFTYSRFDLASRTSP
jgi:hypothetical protein